MKYSEEEFIKQLGLRIKELRKKRGMTQLDVAIQSGIEERSFQRIESGTTNPTAKSLLRICITLNITMAYLFDFE